MDMTQVMQEAEELLKPWAAEIKSMEEKKMLDVRLEADKLLKAVETLEKAHWGYLAAITGLDHPAPKPAEGEAQVGAADDGSVEAIYHFCRDAVVLNLRVFIPYAKPQVPSVCGLIPSATLYERELIEMFGVECVGTPNTDHLVLPEDWPDGVYPLRKSFTGFSNPQPQKGG